MDRVTTEINALVASLHGRGRLRVWSIIISIFGDSVLPHGGTIAATTLGAIADALRIEGGALRSALSRLAKEGWIERHKVGRNSRYSLSPAGLEAFVPAARRIYAADGPETPDNWTLAIRQRGATQEPEGFVALGNGLFVKPADGETAADLDGFLLLEGGIPQIPDWVKNTLGPPEDAAAYHDIMRAFEPLADSLRAGAPLSPLQAITARTLLIHDWRRVVLRHPELPDRFFPDGWPASRCRAFVAELYSLLAPAAEEWLSAAPELSDAADNEIARRFRPI